jgi:hypothetical protein
MVGSYHNHVEHGHTWQLIKTPQHWGGTKVLLVIGQIDRAHQGPSSPSTHPSQTKLEGHMKLNWQQLLVFLNCQQFNSWLQKNHFISWDWTIHITKLNLNLPCWIIDNQTMEMPCIGCSLAWANSTCYNSKEIHEVNNHLQKYKLGATTC